jgi:hypothetical protein
MKREFDLAVHSETLTDSNGSRAGESFPPIHRKKELEKLPPELKQSKKAIGTILVHTLQSLSIIEWTFRIVRRSPIFLRSGSCSSRKVLSVTVLGVADSGIEEFSQKPLHNE